MANFPLLRVLVVGFLFACAVVRAEKQIFSFDSASESFDDGHRRVDEITETAFDSSARSMGPQTYHHKSVRPSAFHEADNSVASHRQRAERTERHDAMMKQFGGSFARHGGFRRGFLTKPRTVDSPAISDDSGGRGRASQRLANSISKIFNVKNGHYADIYNRIDYHEPLSTRRPVEYIEETVKRAMQKAINPNY